MRYALAAVILAALAIPAAAFEELNEGFWIVAGSFPQRGYDRNDAALAKAASRLRRCGFRPFNDFSAKFHGFAPGYDVIVTGPYSFKAEADAIISRVRACIPAAYVKRGRYLGE